MVSTPTGRGWMSPAAIARAVGGRVVRSGQAARRVTTDSRQLRRGDLFVALVGPNFDGHDFVGAALRRGAAGLIVDRPLRDLRLPQEGFVVRVADTTEALMELGAEHRRRAKAKVVAITGSCGKTSTKDILGEILSAAMPTVCSPLSFNNQIGVPLSLLQITSRSKAAVIEIGTNAPGEVSALSRIAQPDIAMITCISEAHLSGLGDLGGVAREKSGIFDGLREDGLAIVNGDDSSCRAIADRLDRRCIRIGVGHDEADWFATDLRFHGLGTSFRLQGERPVTLPRIGSHNVYNALLCVAAATELGVSQDVILSALCGLQATPRRMEHKEMAGVRVFDDTYNMNPASAQAALDALSGIEAGGRKVVVFGEMLELGERSRELHRELGGSVANSGVDLLITVGPGARPIADGARGAGLSASKVLSADDPSHALEMLAHSAGSGDLILCKASRRVGLDRLVDGLQRELGMRYAEAQQAD